MGGVEGIKTELERRFFKCHGKLCFHVRRGQQGCKFFFLKAALWWAPSFSAFPFLWYFVFISSSTPFPIPGKTLAHSSPPPLTFAWYWVPWLQCTISILYLGEVRGDQKNKKSNNNNNKPTILRIWGRWVADIASEHRWHLSTFALQHWSKDSVAKDRSVSRVCVENTN